MSEWRCNDAAVTSAGPRTSRRKRDRVVGVTADDEILDVEDDVGDVFADTGDGVELVQRIVETNLRNGGARDARQQRAPQRVAKRVTEAGL